MIGSSRATWRRRVVCAWVLLATQIFHGAIPARTGADTRVGPVVGLALLLASVFAVVGLTRERDWGRPLLGWTGLVVATGFTLYHALPFASAFTNPYFGEDLGVLPWLSVVLAIVTGLWAAAEGLTGRSRPEHLGGR